MASRKRKAGDIKEGKRTCEIAVQIDHAARLLINFRRPSEIRDELAATYGLTHRTAERRLASARGVIARDVNASDRQEEVAKLLQQCLKIAQEASETRQLSNAIGAMRLYTELLGLGSKG